MKRHLLIQQLQNTVWALHPAALAKVTQVLTRWAAGMAPTAEVMAMISADKEARAAKQASNARAGGGSIAVLPLYGILTQRGNMADDISGPGSCSTQQFTQTFRSALNDDTIGGIILDIDSPGGSVFGVAELAAEIMQARGQKPIFGISNSLCASGAYWIGSACSELYCTPGGEVGSIGVYTAHFDYSGAMEQDGVKATLISAGEYKTEGHPYGPLTDEAKAAIQQSVDAYYAAFTQGVSKGRGVPVAAVREGMGQGRCLVAAEALAAGMTDGTMTFDDVVAKMQKQMRANRGTVAETIKPETVAVPFDAIKLAKARLLLAS